MEEEIVLSPFLLSLRFLKQVSRRFLPAVSLVFRQGKQNGNDVADFNEFRSLVMPLLVKFPAVEHKTSDS